MKNTNVSAGKLRAMFGAVFIAAGITLAPAIAGADEPALELMKKQSESFTLKRGFSSLNAYKAINDATGRRNFSGDLKMRQWVDYWEQYREEQLASMREREETRKRKSKIAKAGNATAKSISRANAATRKSFGDLMEEYRQRYSMVVRPSVTSKPVTQNATGSKTAQKKRGGRSSYDSIIARHAKANGIPLSLAHAVVHVESSYRANARGGAGEIGLMQLKLSTARMMGYRGSAKGLYNPETNIKYGMKYLGKARKLAGGTTCGTILKYNAGHGAKRMNPVSSRYCSKVKRLI